LKSSGGGNDRDPGLRFYPDYLLEILVVAVIALEAVLVLGFLFPAVLGRRIDLVGRFSPRPEWYFLWLYELVKYFPGRSAVLGTVVVPGMMFLSLLFVPWIDADGRRKWFVRCLWVGIVVSAAVLTALSIRDPTW